MNALYDLARVTTATTGTGTITLGAAATGWLTFAQAGVPDGAVVTYAIEDANGGHEIGRGTYTLSGTTLSRDAVYRSTGAANTGKITLSGSAQVFISPAAEDLQSLPSNYVFGITDGSGAPSGGIGEYSITAITQANGIALSSGVVANVTSIILGAGDFDVSANVLLRLLAPFEVWTSQATAADNAWNSIAYAPTLGTSGRLVAVASTGTNRVMYSDDGGVTWTAASAANAVQWSGVAWSPSLALFVAVASGGTAAQNAMSSPDGITWTARTAASNNNWVAVTWSPDLALFCAVSVTGTGTRVMTSTNGTAWTGRTSAADNNWRAIVWSPALTLFVAVANSGSGNRVMTSSDGVTWTTRTSAADNLWRGVAWSPALGMFAAVSADGTDRVMTSTNGTAWTSRTLPNAVQAIAWDATSAIFVAVGGGGVFVSEDGITWVAYTEAVTTTWTAIVIDTGHNIAVAVTATATLAGHMAMTSPGTITTVTRATAGASLVSAALQAQGQTRWRWPFTGARISQASEDATLGGLRIRGNSAASQTVYLVAEAKFTGQGVRAYGNVVSRRIR